MGKFEVTVPEKRHHRVFFPVDSYEDFKKRYVGWLPVLQMAMQIEQDFSELHVPGCDETPICSCCGTKTQLMSARIVSNPQHFGAELDLWAGCPNRFDGHGIHTEAVSCLISIPDAYIYKLKEDANA